MDGRVQAVEAARFESQRSGLLRAFDAFKEGLMVCSSHSPDLQILFFNDAWSKMTGTPLPPGVRIITYPEMPKSL